MTLLEVVDVTKGFAGLRALSGVSIQVDAGERVGLIGPNGAGKTTLFNCILGAAVQDEGSIAFGGRDVSALPVHARARLGMGRTFQRAGLFTEMTVRDHLVVAQRGRAGRSALLGDVFGRRRPALDDDERCGAILALLGIDDLAEEPVESLTLGQARLVEVGRALATEPRVLLLDEPSSGLDRVETAALADTLRAVQDSEGFGILLVDHDLELVSGFADRCYVLDSGQVIADGPTAEVLADPVVREVYLGEIEGAAP